MFFNIVISLAGKSQRFFDEGYTKPKYYLPMADGKTMIENSVDSLDISGNLILIVQKEDCKKYGIDLFLLNKYPNATIRFLDRYTEGAVYIATKDLIDNDNPLVISNCDQIIEWDSNDFIKKTLEEGVDGCVFENPLVAIHSWKKGSHFCRSAEDLFKNSAQQRNNFYTVPLKQGEKYYSVGTPEQYYSYLETKFGSVKSTQTLDSMKRGWLVGNFEPSILKTDLFEVAYMKHKKDEYWPPHTHNEINEYNVLIKGKMKINNESLEEGSVFIIPKGMLSHARFLKDCEVLCIKVPSVPSDKHCF